MDRSTPVMQRQCMWLFHLCSCALCRETCCLYWNFLPHVGQEYCSLFSWFRTCSFQYFFTFVVNELHMSHLYSTLLWLSACTTKSAFRMNHLSHPLYMHLCVLIVLWTILCCSNCPWKLNRRPHMLHGIFSCFWCSYWCTWKVEGTLNTLLHSVHSSGGWLVRWCSFRSCTLLSFFPHFWHLYVRFFDCLGFFSP